MSAKPTGKIIRVVKTGLVGGLSDGGGGAKGGLGRFQPHAVPKDAEAEARFTFQFPIEMVGVIAEFARDLRQTDARGEALTKLFEQV